MSSHLYVNKNRNIFQTLLENNLFNGELDLIESKT